MQLNSDRSFFSEIADRDPVPDALSRVMFLAGDIEIVKKLAAAKARVLFDERIVDFLGDVSRELMGNKSAKMFSDVVTFAFWIRKASINKLKERFRKDDHNLRLGRGVAFHIAPSNVPVNFAYSLVSGLLTGNSNIVRVPSKDFPQIDLIMDAFNTVMEKYEEIKPYILCVRYERDKKINDLFSSIADVRVIWGGDQTIEELRKSSLPSRSTEITFADRHSLAVIDSDRYMSIEDKKRVAWDFYNDTFFSDQNACTSPKIVIWTGDRIDEAKEMFWKLEHELVKENYHFQDIMAVNKLTSAYLASRLGCKLEKHTDNLIVRVRVPKITEELMDNQNNSGYFYEYDCHDIKELIPVCDNKRCQTVGIIGDREMMRPVLEAGVKGIDRVVEVGKTMNFDLIWDGYDLVSQLTRIIAI